MSIKMSLGVKVCSMTRACSASTAVRASYPSSASSMRASFRLKGLSSTMRMGSPAMLNLHEAVGGFVREGITRLADAGQDGRERAAHAWCALDGHEPSLCLDDALRHRKPQARACVLLRRARVELLEFDEQPVQ